MQKELFQAIFKERQNIFLTGPGGCGKSYLAKLIKEEAKSLEIKCQLTSTTGVSAFSLGNGAMTIHSFSGIGLGNKPLEYLLKKVKPGTLWFKNWKSTGILIIDEISMLSAETLDLISNLGSLVLRKRNQAPELFGGIQIIFTGDFLQLPPVSGNFAFNSDIWKKLNLKIFNLTIPYRYPDPSHFDFLMRARVGKLTEEDVTKVNSRVESYKEYCKNPKAIGDIMPTQLFSKRLEVEAINKEELNELKEDEYNYSGKDNFEICVDPKTKLPVVSSFDENVYTLILDEVIPKKVSLKKHAQVMLTVNLCVEAGLMNGARGIVLECNPKSVLVKFNKLNRNVDNCEIKIGENNEVEILPYIFEYTDDIVLASRKQFPLKLAYCLTIHKSQGSTLDLVTLDLGYNLFSDGMGYVALSRCKTLDGIYVLSFMREKISANKEALEFEKEIIEKEGIFLK